MSTPSLSFFPSPSIDHAVAGLGAGAVSVLCMQPLDLLKVKLQVATTPPSEGAGRHIYNSLRNIYRAGGVRALYRGVSANVVGNASSWGLYFLFYTAIKERMTEGSPQGLTSSGYLIASAEASAVTALMTNPLWVVKVRMFTTTPETPGAYRSVWHGLYSVAKYEGYRGLWKGTLLALIGVTNGAVQFMAYEQMKKWGFARKRKRIEKTGRAWTPLDDRLTNTEYTAMSGFSKLFALMTTYPYQVVRSRVQSQNLTHLYPNIRTTVARTWSNEGFSGFYRGLGTNIIRVLPGTCVTLVVYENIAYLLRWIAVKRTSAG